MKLPEVWELFEYWREFPPTHIILAARYLERRGHDDEPTGSEVGMLNALARNGPAMSSATLPLAVQGAIEQMKRSNG